MIDIFCSEGRFGAYRQQNGGNYFAAVNQIVRGEKAIKIKTLLTKSRATIEELMQLRQDAPINRSISISDVETVTDIIKGKLATPNFDTLCLIRFISGALIRKIKCQECR